jgi:peptidoglycan hydrolase CwlO-like protein
MLAEIIRKRIEAKNQELKAVQDERRKLQEAINNTQFKVDQLQMLDAQVSGAIVELEETLKELEGDVTGKVVNLPAPPEPEVPESINAEAIK